MLLISVNDQCYVFSECNKKPSNNKSVSATTGSDAVSEYFPEFRNSFNNIHTCPEELLTWFHHVPWDFRMKSGRTFWEELCYRYDEGVNDVITFRNFPDSLVLMIYEKMQSVPDSSFSATSF